MLEIQTLKDYFVRLEADLNAHDPVAIAAPSEPELLPVYEAAQDILAKRFKDAPIKIKGFEHDLQREIRNFFSRVLLLPLEREWTGHGINRTFRFWTEKQKTDYLRFAQKVLKALKRDYLASLGYGSVLSIVRDNDLIPHDDDLDIIVALKTDDVTIYNAELARLHTYLEEAGFAVRGDYVAHRHVSDGTFMIDVFFGLQTGTKVSWHPGPREVLNFHDVFPTKTEMLFGIECDIPRDSEHYLATVYGENWRTPLPGWTHNFDPVGYQDWFWPKPK